MIFSKNLRDYQKEYLSTILKENLNDIVLSSPCGTGKTAMSLFLVGERAKQENLNLLVIVPTNFLKEQWVDRITEFYLDVKKEDIALLNSSKDLNFKKISIITLNLLASLLKTEAKIDLQYRFNFFNFVVFDEAHNVGAETFYPITTVLTAKYRLALSATFRRKDNVQIILKHCFGKQYYMDSPFPKCKLNFVNCEFEYKNFGFLKENQFKSLADTTKNSTTFEKVVIKDKKYYIYPNIFTAKKTWTNQLIYDKINQNLDLRKNPQSYSIIESIFSEFDYIKDLVNNIIVKCLAENRKILVLAKRTKILQELFSQWEQREQREQKLNSTSNVSSVQLILGKANKSGDYLPTYEINKRAKIIFGINQLASEGLDADFLDTLIMIHPISDVEQAFGRIRRKKEGKQFPTVFILKGHHLLDKVSEPNEITKLNAENPVHLNDIVEIA